MLINANDVIGLRVVSLKKGENIEDVNDVIYDPPAKQVRALLVDRGGWFSEAKVILLSDVKSIGRDAVMVDTKEVIKKASDLPEPLSSVARESKLKKMNIFTESGTDLGRVTNIVFDPASGYVREFEVSQGAIQDIKTGRKYLLAEDVVRVGVDDIIVKDEAEANFQKQAKKREEQVAKAEKGAEKAVEKTKGKVQEVVESPSIQTSTARIKSGAEKFASDVQTRYGQIRSEQKNTRIKNALGQYLTKTILLPNDQVLAKRGEMINYEMINKAEKNGLLEQVLDNAAKEPLNE